MVSKEFVANITEAYLISYDMAMQRTKSPGYAAQVAGTVIIAITTAERQYEKENQPSPGEAFMAMLANQMAAARAEAERNERKEGKKRRKDEDDEVQS